MAAVALPPLNLEPISGPVMRPVTLQTDQMGSPAALGRSSSCRVVLADPDGAVSRLHAEIAYLPDDPLPWRLKDAGSRHGTFLNGERLQRDQSTPIRPGDQVRIGPWTFRVVIGEVPATRRLAATMDDRRFTGTLVQRLGAQPLESGAQRRLNILMRCAADIASARTESDVASVALHALVEGVGFPRCAILRIAAGDSVEILASSGTGDARFSRSLIHAAADPENGAQTVTLNPGQMLPVHELGQSITMLDISAALCAPILVDRIPAPRADAGFVSGEAPRAIAVPDAFVYLDSRGSDRASAPISSEAVAFCQSVARLCGLALSNLQRAEIEQEAHRRQGELAAARDVQRIIMPPLSGRFSRKGGGALEYHVLSIPGRLVAGDLFDVFRIDDSRVGLFLGDVVGKGVAAGMVMSNVQAHLARLLRSEGDPAPALNEVGRLVAAYSSRLSEEHGRVSLFISLFAGVFDLATATLTYSDAGHGYTLLRRPGREPERPFLLGGAPLGVAPDSVYESSSVVLEPGARVLLFSDGLTEQRNATGKAFGVERAVEAMRQAGTPGQEVHSLVDALRSYCGSVATDFADDITVASVAFE
ncbi:Phosphoserine phosphatase RsbU [Phycisphaerales bacterium]|nr:Phosphoserine phosphatase RsbU [Phycisphaerales bacterium]